MYTYTHIYTRIYTNIRDTTYMYVDLPKVTRVLMCEAYGMATMSRLLKNISLFCKRAL